MKVFWGTFLPTHPRFTITMDPAVFMWGRQLSGNCSLPLFSLGND